MASNNDNTTPLGNIPPQDKPEKPTENQGGAPIGPPARDANAPLREAAGNNSGAETGEKPERPAEKVYAERPERAPVKPVLAPVPEAKPAAPPAPAPADADNAQRPALKLI